jgi:hypothetical protein
VHVSAEAFSFRMHLGYIGRLQVRGPVRTMGRWRQLYFLTSSHGSDRPSCMDPARQGEGFVPICVEGMFTGKVRKRSC